MLAAAVLGLLVGALIGFLATSFLRDQIEARGAKPTVWYKHEASGQEYEFVCRASMRDGSGPFFVFIKYARGTDGMNHFDREIWLEQEVQEELVKAR